MIGILYSRLRIEEKLLIQAFEKQQKKIKHIDPRTLLLGDIKTNQHIYSLILNREISQIRSELLLEYFEHLGITTVNTSQVTRLCNNKAVTTWALEKAGVPTPKTYTVFSLSEALKAAEHLSYPFVIKPISGSWGRLLAKVDNQNTLEAILEHKEALPNPQQSIFYLQEYIDKPERDIRIFVVNNEPIAAMYRTSEHWITNTALGGQTKPCELDDQLKKLVKQVIQTLKIDIAGIDILETKSGYQVLEVNSTPEFHGLQEVTHISIADKIADFIIEKEKSL